MSNELYLIHREDYVGHIDDKVRLYSMLKQINHMISRLPSNRGNKELTDLAVCFDIISDEMFRSWGIPKSYLVFGHEAALSNLMENELIAPEDAGYVCDDDDDENECDGCECCSECCTEDDEDEADTFAEDMATLASALHNIFGDNVSIHISVE